MENGLIWVQDDSDIKLLVNKCRKGEAHAYIEHLVDEPVGFIENIDAEKATFEAIPNVEETNQTACDACPSGNRIWMQLKILRRPILKQLTSQLKRK